MNLRNMLCFLSLISFGITIKAQDLDIKKRSYVSFEAERIYLMGMDTTSVRSFSILIDLNSLNQEGEYNFYINQKENVDFPKMIYKNRTLYNLSYEREKALIGKNADQLSDSSRINTLRKHLTQPWLFDETSAPSSIVYNTREAGFAEKVILREGEELQSVIIVFDDYRFDDNCDKSLFDISLELDNYELVYYDAKENERRMNKRQLELASLDEKLLTLINLFSEENKKIETLASFLVKETICVFWYRGSEKMDSVLQTLKDIPGNPTKRNVLFINPFDINNSVVANNYLSELGINRKSYFIKNDKWRQLRMPSIPYFILFNEEREIIGQGQTMTELNEKQSSN